MPIPRQLSFVGVARRHLHYKEEGGEAHDPETRHPAAHIDNFYCSSGKRECRQFEAGRRPPAFRALVSVDA
jgi:hypothetical protein